MQNSARSTSGAYKPPEPVLWPSERIPMGGLFHTPKVEYSKETADLLRLLMKESRMSMMMRKQVETHLRSGEPLPRPEPPRINISADPDAEAMEILRRAHNAKRKSLNKIIASGAYEMPVNRPRPDNRTPSDVDKKQLQERMAGVRLSETNLKPMPRKAQKPEIDVTPDDIINELLDQINERADWLAEMEALGQGKRYREEVRSQIAERLRHIKSLESKQRLQKEGFRVID